jgi:hypothetical protein
MSTPPSTSAVPASDNSNALAAAFVLLILAALVVFGYTLMKAQAGSEVAEIVPGPGTSP